MLVKVMHENDLVAEINLTSNGLVYVTNYTNDIFLQPFGNRVQVGRMDYMNFLSGRCIPSTRANFKEFLTKIGVPLYADMLKIIRVTNGWMAEDHLWVLFEDSKETTWKEVDQFNRSL